LIEQQLVSDKLLKIAWQCQFANSGFDCDLPATGRAKKEIIIGSFGILMID
jgi:hypothetical protein